LYKNLNITSDTNRDTTLAGDGTLRSLQARMQELGTKTISGLTNVRTLADIGIKTARDGSLSIDESTLEKAISRDPSAINSLFSQNTSGLGDLSSDLVDNYVNSVDGLLSSRKTTMQKRITSMDDEAASYEMRLEIFRKTLVARFTAMEKIVSGLKSVGNFLTQQEASSSKG
jgi:flagellar hook-associated protein 2